MKFAPRDGSTARTLATIANPLSHRVTMSDRGVLPGNSGITGDRGTARSPRAITSGRPQAGLVKGRTEERSSPSRQAATTYRKGEEIMTPGTGVGLVYIVRSGCVRLYKVLTDGRSISLGLLGPSTLFTQEDAFDGLSSGATAEAMTDSTVSIVPSDELAGLIAASPELASAVVAGMTRRLTEMQTLVEQLLARDTSVRLATTLLSLAARFGRPMADGMLAITLPLTHQTLANMIGSNRVTVTRKLLELQGEGVVRSLGRNALAVSADLLRVHAQPAAAEALARP